MNAVEKLVYHKLSVLKLAQTVGNVSKACRQRGVTRTQFYEYKRRFQTWNCGVKGFYIDPHNQLIHYAIKKLVIIF